jgi:hypothetical protein
MRSTVRLPRSICEELAADLAGRGREPEALAHRLEQARTAALADRERTQRGPAVVTLAETAGS